MVDKIAEVMSGFTLRWVALRALQPKLDSKFCLVAQDETKFGCL